MDKYDIWYMKPDHFRRFIFGAEVPTRTDLENTHTYVTTIDTGDLEDVFCYMQAENWSPNGEARDRIRSLELEHTSMSVGDVVYDRVNDKWFVVGTVGFREMR